MANEKAIDWIFVVDTLNFSFWTDNESSFDKYSVSYGGKSYTGYWALCAAINRAQAEGYAITEASFLATLDDKTASHIFRGENPQVPIPLLEERIAILRDTGKTLIDVSFLNNTGVQTFDTANVFDCSNSMELFSLVCSSPNNVPRHFSISS